MSTTSQTRECLPLEQQIDAFCELMIRKGYDGIFQYDYEHLGKLAEALRGRVLSQSEVSPDIGPVQLTTFYVGQGENCPYVKFEFRITYDANNGFRVSRMSITHANLCVAFRVVHVIAKSNEDIPIRTQAHRMVLGTHTDEGN
ncbi:MAG TPA: hypothetical protein VK658_26560 [Chryseolinea sp.]|nr:hypothetical protein [Chryseolinea sp.]